MHCNLQSPDNLHPVRRRGRPGAAVGVIAAALLGLPLAACSPGGASNPKPTSSSIGQAVALGGEEYTVWSVSAHSYVGPPAQPLRAKAGDVLIVVRYEVHNLGGKPLAAASALQVSMVDPQGVVVAPDPTLTAAYLSTSELKDATPNVAAGERVKLARVFETPVATYPHGWAIVIGDKTHRVELQ